MLSVGILAFQATAMLHAVAVQSNCECECRLGGTTLHPEADSCARWRQCTNSRQQNKQKGKHALCYVMLYQLQRQVSRKEKKTRKEKTKPFGVN